MQKWGILFILIYTLSACTYTEKIRDGKTAYERKQFTIANQLLTNEIKKVKIKVVIITDNLDNFIILLCIYTVKQKYDF